ncbi:MAG: UDP-N-acetylmuramate dehydrogenase [Lachnospiraceae bacterium]|nr:UDP-N-acetylmuramate dehydrogenase [Lachnospiraceae bacterium]MBQ9934912.1 UDP-N-acetylmuramate dehydrogenase [Lachnospiraceae bacterium]
MQSIFEDINFRENELMSGHTTFRIGGPAKYFFAPKTAEEIVKVIDICRAHNIRYMIVGNGSNMLFSDKGFDGAIIQIFSNFNQIDEYDDGIYANAGALLSKIAAVARDNSMTGMEFAAGIPGTLGGAVVMNAGAYGGEMKDIIEYVDILEADGKIKRYSCADMGFGYRKSIVTGDRIVLGAKLKLKDGNQEAIQARMDELKEARTSKQPLELPSAGSTFKRPEGYFAGKLIDDSGLRGYKCGGAMVSEKHCGFVVNYNNATCEDVLELIKQVQDVVEEKYGVRLEPEVKIIL